MRSILSAVMMTAALFGSVASALADQVTLVANKDVTLYEDPNGYTASGFGPTFFVGMTNGEQLRRALVSFNLSTIPAGSTITSVTVTLYMSRTQADAEPVTFHRALATWGEANSVAGGQGGLGGFSQDGDATWIHRFYPNVFWSTPGGDYSPTVSATTDVDDNGYYSWSGPGLVADVQAWVSGQAPNNGWLLKGNEAVPMTAKRFESRQSGTANRRPSITVVYTPPGQSGACCLPSGQCVVTTQTQCGAQGGVFQGLGTNCSPNPCPQPTGACCLPTGVCEVLTAVQCAAQGGTYQGDAVPCSAGLCPLVLTPFVDKLPRPAVAQPVTGEPGGAASYTIAMTEFQQQLHRDLPPTTVWGYGGSYPGPTIEAARGQPVSVMWVNNLRGPDGELRTTHYLPVDHCLHGPDHTGDAPVTVVHLHGGHVPADSDGYPEDAFPPGEQSHPYDYPNNQPAATLWYHDHALGLTRLNVYMGLAGFYLLRDAQEAALGLPSGEYEVPLAIQDRSFNTDGSLQYPEHWHEHFFGDFILVNGKVWPFMNVHQGKYRFRLLNGSNSRTYTLSLSNGRPFHMIGTDGGLLPAPVTMSQLTIAPGERADVIIDFGSLSAGTEVILTNSAPAPFPGEPGVGVIPNVMKFIVGEDIGHAASVPATLVPVEPLPLAAVARERSFELRQFPDPCTGTRWFINGLLWDDITEFPRLGSTEIWSFVNRSSMVHPMHLHLVFFQVLDRQPFQVINDQIVPIGQPVPPDSSEAGWKDTVRVMPNEIVRVITRFEGYTGLFAYHCHILEHEDHEMMRQFRTVCTADWNTDLAVNSSDLSAFITDWLASVNQGRLVADVNNDGAVNSTDLSAFITLWLAAVTGGGC